MLDSIEERREGRERREIGMVDLALYELQKYQILFDILRISSDFCTFFECNAVTLFFYSFSFLIICGESSNLFFLKFLFCMYK